ncbi:MAG: MerR family transcriptional regulator [Synergistales bacterium]|nr:MerR family transcriptional regulator [Synergistales bacterium]
MDKLSIGEMAAINRVSVQALRLYDRMGLLKPQFIDINRYRYYDIKQSARLDMIQSLQLLGMSLRQIKEQLDKQDVSVVQGLLEMQKNRLDEQIAQLRATRRSVERTLINYRRYHSAPGDGMIFTEFMPERKIYCYDSRINFYDFGLETYEYILRELKTHIALNELPMAYFCNVGTILRQERLARREFISTEVFIFVDDDFQCSSNIEVLPSRTYLCISCDNFHKEKSYAERLLAYAAEKDLAFDGDYICEVVTDLPVFVGNERSMFIKLQIPIKF